MVFYASTQKNAVPQTIFNERGLALVAVPWPWAVALKLGGHAKQDPTDRAAVLRPGVAQHTIRWTRAVLSVTRFHSRNQGSVMSCHAVLTVPSHFLYNQGP